MPDIVPKLFARRHLKCSSNHIKFIKLRSRDWQTFVNIVVTHVLSQEDIQEIQDSPPVLGNIWLQSFKNSTRVLLLSH